jgi:hypothetical protein
MKLKRQNNYLRLIRRSHFEGNKVWFSGFEDEINQQQLIKLLSQFYGFETNWRRLTFIVMQHLSKKKEKPKLLLFQFDSTSTVGKNWICLRHQKSHYAILFSLKHILNVLRANSFLYLTRRKKTTWGNSLTKYLTIFLGLKMYLSCFPTYWSFRYLFHLLWNHYRT